MQESINNALYTTGPLDAVTMHRGYTTHSADDALVLFMADQ